MDIVNLNHKFLKTIQITSHEHIIINSFDTFYQNIDNITLFLSLVQARTNISIRLIDYFITKYSKYNKINYPINNTIFNVHISYKQQLKAYQKKHFDPFSRGLRIPYFLNSICIITTIGQLNFFKWFISKNIYEYICNNQETIEKEMNTKKKIEKKNNIKKIKKIKQYNISCTNSKVNNTVSFF